MITLRRTIALGAAVVAAVGLTTIAASPAAAGTVAVNYTCSGFGGPVHHRTVDVTITAPATASPGQTVTLTASVVDRVPVSQPIAAGRIKVNLQIDLGGASTGSVEATGLTNPELRAGDLWQVHNGTAQVTLANVGDVTYRPARWMMTTAMFGCGVKYGETAPIAATTRVR